MLWIWEIKAFKENQKVSINLTLYLLRDLYSVTIKNQNRTTGDKSKGIKY